VGGVDTVSVLFVAFSITVSLSGEYEESASNTMGGTIIIPIPIPSITTDTIEVIALIVILFTYYYE
jgi:hypothetical protein